MKRLNINFRNRALIIVVLLITNYTACGYSGGEAICHRGAATKIANAISMRTMVCTNNPGAALSYRYLMLRDDDHGFEIENPDEENACYENDGPPYYERAAVDHCIRAIYAVPCPTGTPYQNTLAFQGEFYGHLKLAIESACQFKELWKYEKPLSGNGGRLL